MEVKASVKNIRISPRKVRLVAGLIKKMETSQALDQLAFCSKNAAAPLAKLVNSAVANAVNNFSLNKDNLYIKELRVDEGRMLKRWQPKARGRATPIRKRTSRVSIVLAELVASGQAKAKKQSLEAPIKMAQKPKREGEAKVDNEAKEKKKESAALLEKGKKIIDERKEGRRGHAVIEGGASKGFVSRIFRRKSG